MDREMVAATVVSFILAAGIGAVLLDDRDQGAPVIRLQGDTSCPVTTDDPTTPLLEVHRSNYSCFYRDTDMSVAFRFTTDQYGFRGDPVDPDASYTVAMIGNSQTFGWGVNRSDTIPSLLEDRLQEDTGIPDAQVINTGALSYGMRDYRLMFRHYVAPLQPDRVIVVFRWQDVLDMATEATISEEIRQETNLSQSAGDEFDREFSERVQAYREQQREQIITGEADIFDEMEQIITIGREEDIDVVFAAYEPMHPDLQTAFQDWAQAHNATVLMSPDAFTPGDHHPPDRYTIPGPDTHYNRRGNGLIADHIHAQLSWPGPGTDGE